MNSYCYLQTPQVNDPSSDYHIPGAIEPSTPMWCPLKGSRLTSRQKHLSLSDQPLLLHFLSVVLT